MHLLDDGGDLRELGHVLQLEREHMRAAAGGRDPRELIADNFPRCLWAVLHIYTSVKKARSTAGLGNRWLDYIQVRIKEI